jgi:hypothetical protein
MSKRLFWFCLGAAAAVFGINYMKKKVEDDSEAFSSENIADTMTDMVVALKKYIVALWQGVTSGESLDDEELAKIFDDSRN